MYNRRNCSKKIILHILYDLIVLVEGFWFLTIAFQWNTK